MPSVYFPPARELAHKGRRSEDGTVNPDVLLTIKTKCHIFTKTDGPIYEQWETWDWVNEKYITGDGSYILDELLNSSKVKSQASVNPHETRESCGSIGGEIVRRMIENYEKGGL